MEPRQRTAIARRRLVRVRRYSSPRLSITVGQSNGNKKSQVKFACGHNVKEENKVQHIFVNFSITTTASTHFKPARREAQCVVFKSEHDGPDVGQEDAVNVITSFLFSTRKGGEGRGGGQ